MNAGKLVLTVLVCCLVSLCLMAVFTDRVSAGSTQSFDAAQAEKKGMDALGSKEFDQNKLPGKMKIGFAFGSLVAAIAVIKYF